MAQQKMKSLDPTRIYSATPGATARSTSTTYHHPISLQRIQDTLNAPSRVFFDEVLGLFHGWMDLALFEDLDPGMRDYWIEGLPDIERSLNAGENQVGRGAVLLGGRRVPGARQGNRVLAAGPAADSLHRSRSISCRSAGWSATWSGERWTAGGGPGRNIGSRRSSTRPCKSRRSRWPSRNRQADRRARGEPEPVRRSGSISSAAGNLPAKKARPGRKRRR